MVRKIALNGLFLDLPHTGTGTYTRNLAPELVRLDPGTEYKLIVRGHHSTYRAVQANVSVSIPTRRPPWPTTFGATATGWPGRLDKLFWEQAALPAGAGGCQLLHSLYFAAPLLHSGSLVVTVHDAISLDGSYTSGTAARLYGRAMRQTVRRADAIITPSHHARNEVASALGLPVDRIRVIAEAPDPHLKPIEDPACLDSLRSRLGLPTHYLLYLGGTEKRKNLDTLVRAWARVDRGDVKLVIVGRFPGGPLFPNIPLLAETLRVSDAIVFVSDVSQADLAALYSGSEAFCYPSCHEGFGLPPVEAMACGRPVLAADATSLTEVVGQGGVLIAPTDVEAWAGALARVLTDAGWRAKLSRQALDHVARYSWTATARQTIDVYREVLNPR